MKSYIFTYYHL